MPSERQKAARRISEQASDLARVARNVGLDTLAYLLDAVRLEANQHFNWQADATGYPPAAVAYVPRGAE